jgi:hypothetical protein
MLGATIFIRKPIQLEAFLNIGDTIGQFPLDLPELYPPPNRRREIRANCVKIISGR